MANRARRSLRAGPGQVARPFLHEPTIEDNLAERFEFHGDLREELLAYEQRLQQVAFGEKLRVQLQAFPRRPRRKQTFWQKIGSYFFVLRRLRRIRRQVDDLEAELAHLRETVIAVVDGEFSALSAGMRALIALTQKTSGETNEAIGRLASETNEAIGRLAGETHDAMNRLAAETSEATARIADGSARSLTQATTKLTGDIDAVMRRLQMERLTRQKAFTDFDRRFRLAASAGKLPAAPASGAGAPANGGASQGLHSTSLQSTLESFYYLLEERYRGTREEIKQRLFVYRNDLNAARDRAGANGPVIDIGCGRGELLELLAEDGFSAVGVDSNDTQLEIARRHGVPVIHGDAFAYLQSLEDHSVLAVTGIHIVEHIPFPDLAQLMQEVVRVLRKGGVAIFETPNPRNLIVGATNFHFDPTHMRPLPPEVMQVLLETVGFAQQETRPLHPYVNFDEILRHENMNRDLATLLFGPQDYAIIGVME